MSTPAPPPPPRDLDELASAIVDGHLSAADAAQARRDPLVAQRVEDMLAVRAALRTTPPSPPGAMDASVEAALGAYDFTRSARPARAARAARSRRSRDPAPWLAAAAAVVVVGLLVAGLVRLDPDDSPTHTAQETGESDAAEGGAGDSEAPMASDESGDDSAAPEDGAVELDDELSTNELALDLGSATTVDELRSLVEQNYSGGVPGASPRAPEAPAATVDPQTTTVPLCAGLSDAGDPAWGKVTFDATAMYQGESVRVHVYERVDGSTRLIATDLECVDVVDVPFQGAP